MTAAVTGCSAWVSQYATGVRHALLRCHGIQLLSLAEPPAALSSAACHLPHLVKSAQLQQRLRVGVCHQPYAVVEVPAPKVEQEDVLGGRQAALQHLQQRRGLGAGAWGSRQQWQPAAAAWAVGLEVVTAGRLPVALDTGYAYIDMILNPLKQYGRLLFAGCCRVQQPAPRMPFADAGSGLAAPQGLMAQLQTPRPSRCAPSRCGRLHSKVGWAGQCHTHCSRFIHITNC